MKRYFCKTFPCKEKINILRGKNMYIISRMPSGKWFGESFVDGYYCEADTYFEVSEKMTEHDKSIS